MPNLPNILNFREVDKSDNNIVGGKGANLGEMTKAGFPVPNGFCITINAYDIFLRENKLIDSIYNLLKVTDVNDTAQLENSSRKIQKMVTTGFISKEVASDIIASYKKLSGRFKQSLVAVRTSATAEDMPDSSFAGMGTTLLNVKGEANLLHAVRECWASLFTARSIYYRVTNKIPHEKVKISVVVQKMVQSEVSGVMFSIDTVKNDKDRIIIESVWGLGEMIVQGSVVPDTYIVQKDTFSILSKEISDQKVQLVRTSSGENKEKEVPIKIRDKQKITDKDIVDLAKLADKLQKHYYFPQDSEWAKEKGKLYLIQTRPVTTVKAVSQLKNETTNDITTSNTPILSGSGASPGIGTGIVKILKSPKEIERIKKGDILVASMTSPDYVPAMKKSSAVVTNEGGQTSHAAIVSRELGIPCVVGTKEATKILKEGQIVTVNGETGQIYVGSPVKKVDIKNELVKKTSYSKTKTATKLYVNLAEPDRAGVVSKMNVDGVGLLRAEFMIANIGVHPKEAIKRKEQDDFVKKLARDIEVFCKNFYPRPITYRATDFKTNEYRSLNGGKYWEPIEPNPMLGFRGAFRYIANPEVFNLELLAIKKVREKYNNLNLMIPFVRSPEELSKVRRIVASQGLFESASFKFLMMVEIPVNVIQIEDFINVGIDGVSIGSNDLTMLIEGTDRDNSEVASEFDEMRPAVLWALERVIKKCNERGVTSSICGQAPSQYDELVRKLVRWGITGISVNPDSIDRVRGVIAESEKEI